jgi:hypothetical protein
MGIPTEKGQLYSTKLYEEVTKAQVKKSLALAFRKTVLSDEYCSMSSIDRDEFVHVMDTVRKSLTEEVAYCHQKKCVEKELSPIPHASLDNNNASEIHYE